jgi:branched-chain amino acid aminotransferase
MKVWIDGHIVDGAEARISVLDHGLLYGDGIFEGIRIINRRVFRLPDHLRRLEISARAIGLRLPVDRAQMQEIVLATARALDASEAYIRLVVTRGVGELGVDPTHCKEPSVICIVAQLKMFAPEKMARGIDMITSSLRRPPADILDPRVKSLNYLNNVLAKREARMRGADDALILNLQGMVAEASGANIFVASNGILLTPPANDGALEGITRDSVLKCARELGINYRETTLSRYDLLKADEVFLSGTGARVVPVATLDGEILGNGGERPLTQTIIEALNRYSQLDGVAF